MQQPNLFAELNPSPRLLMGPGPVDVDPRVLRAMSTPLLGQFDPEFTQYMNEVMSLYRQVFETQNQWTFLIDGTARAAIEAMLVSMLAPQDTMLVPIFGRFGHLLCEIGERCGARVHRIEAEWGTVFDIATLEAAIVESKPRVVAVVQGDTSTTMAQPLDELGAVCRRHDALLYVDATASATGMPLPVDAWQIDAVSIGLQKCLSGPPGVAPVTFNERVAKVITGRKHIEQGIRPADYDAAAGPIIRSNYFDVAMLMDYWSDSRLNHHTEATTMLYAARECARLVLAEGMDNRFRRHRIASEALVAGFRAMELKLFGDLSHKMPNVTGIYIPENVAGDAVREMMLSRFGIEIGTSFGPLHGKIWRIGTMGYGCQERNVLICLSALETCLRAHGYRADAGAAVDAALAVYDAA